MNPEPRHQGEYESRQVEAARRVLVDLGQVLASFRDCLVVVGGWVPDLLTSEVEEVHVGSIDVDLALDTQKLDDGRYAELHALLRFIITHPHLPTSIVRSDARAKELVWIGVRR